MAINFRKWLCGFAVKHSWRTLYKICDCRRYEPVEPPTVTVRICLDSFCLANEYCPNTEFRQFDEGYEPTIFCSIHKAPEYIWMDVCLHSELLPNPYCQKIEQRRFEKGSEPMEICGICEKPKPEELPKKIQDLHWGGLAFWLRFALDANNIGNESLAIAELRRTLKEIRRHQFSVIDYFLWVMDGEASNEHWHAVCPYVLRDNKPVFTEFNPRFWALYKIFISEIAEADLEPCCCPHISGYQEWAYRSNHSGLRTFFDEPSLPFQIGLTKQVIETTQKIFGRSYLPWIKPNNELDHISIGGEEGHRLGHTFANWYLALWEGIKDTMPDPTDVSKWVCDGSLSNYVFAHFVEPHSCPNCDYIFGNNKFLRNDQRMVIVEDHGKSIVQNFRDENGERLPFFDHWLGSSWHIAPQRFHEDGGGGPLAQGVAWGGFRIGTANQVYEMLKYMWGECVKGENRAIWTLFPLESLQANGIEDYRVEKLNWERPKKAAQAHGEVYSG